MGIFGGVGSASRRVVTTGVPGRACADGTPPICDPIRASTCGSTCAAASALRGRPKGPSAPYAGRERSDLEGRRSTSSRPPAPPPALALGLTLAISATLAACASDPKPKPTEVAGSIVAAADLNPSVSQRASPLMLRIYELKTAAAFNGADFVSMYQRDQAELAADLVAREEMVLSPGEKRPYVKTLAPETRYIGVMAAYRDLERAKWRSIVAIQPGQKQTLAIRADALSVSAAVSPVASK